VERGFATFAARSIAVGANTLPLKEPRSAVFTSTSDPGDQAILAMINTGKEFFERDSPRFDMTNFKPRTDWFREMMSGSEAWRQAPMEPIRPGFERNA
jgi:hypothetical protein